MKIHKPATDLFFHSSCVLSRNFNAPSYQPQWIFQNSLTPFWSPDLGGPWLSLDGSMTYCSDPHSHSLTANFPGKLIPSPSQTIPSLFPASFLSSCRPQVRTQASDSEGELQTLKDSLWILVWPPPKYMSLDKVHDFAETLCSHLQIYSNYTTSIQCSEGWLPTYDLGKHFPHYLEINFFGYPVCQLWTWRILSPESTIWSVIKEYGEFWWQVSSNKRQESSPWADTRWPSVAVWQASVCPVQSASCELWLGEGVF